MATMQQVADLAGVSIGTVSFVINGTRQVTDATRIKVEAAMDKLGYQPNVLAQGLASKKSRIIALAVPVAAKGLGTTQMEYVMGATEAAQERGYQLVLWPAVRTVDADISKLAKQGLVDGVLLMEVRESDSRVEILKSRGLPYVAIGRSDLEGEKFVDVDFEATINEGAGHLRELGHRNIAFVNHSQESLTARYGPTWRGSEIISHGIDGLEIKQFFAEGTVEAGRAVAIEVMKNHPEITAFLIMNEEASFGVAHQIMDSGKVIPEDYSMVLLVSSSGTAARHRPEMARVPAPGREVGIYAARMLIDELDEVKSPLDSYLYSKQFVLGKSTSTAQQH